MSQEHVTSRKVYFAVFAALLALTYATVVVSRIDLGELQLGEIVGFIVRVSAFQTNVVPGLPK